MENPDVVYRDSLEEANATDSGRFSLVLANPPFSGSLDYESTAKDLLQIVRTKKTELLFIALFIRLLKNGGRAAAVVPNGVVETIGTAHRNLRKTLVEKHKLSAVIALPHWIFKPYASVATSILIFTKGDTTEDVWFYRIDNDGFSDDAAKTPKDGSDLPEAARLFTEIDQDNYTPNETKHRLVSIEEIRNNDYDLCSRVYLSGYSYPNDVPRVTVGDLFTVSKGKTAAASAKSIGEFPFYTSSMKPRRCSVASFSGDAICIPIVSATGHGHASIKHIHRAYGNFEASSITAVLQPITDNFDIDYVYFFLLSHKDQLLVPLMRGAANVSLNLNRLKALEIPLPRHKKSQAKLALPLKNARDAITKAEDNLVAAHEDFKNLFSGFGNT